MNYRLIGPMQREIARLNFEGKLQAVSEQQGKITETLSFRALERGGVLWSTRNQRRRRESGADGPSSGRPA